MNNKVNFFYLKNSCIFEYFDLIHKSMRVTSTTLSKTPEDFHQVTIYSNHSIHNMSN